MTRDELKFIQLYFRITHNGTEIPYEDDMESVVTHVSNYSYYLSNWKEFIKRMQRTKGEAFDEWLDSLRDSEEVERENPNIARTLPSKTIEVAWGNEHQLALTLSKIGQEFISKMSKFCTPAVNSQISAYFSMDQSGFAACVYSYDPTDRQLYLSKIRNAVSDIRTAAFNAVKAYNAAQGGEQSDNVLLKEPSFANSSSKNNTESGRGHIISDDTEFEITLHIDEYHVYKSGKGGSVTDDEISQIFDAFTEEFHSIGAEEY